MLVELATTWKPRWYYVFKNITSNILYVGQTTQVDMSTYCGSGGYWVAHCKKHGGYNRSNIEVVEQIWFDCCKKAQYWLDNFETVNPNYFSNENVHWANEAKETTKDSAFCGLTTEQRFKFAVAGGHATSIKRPDVYVQNGLKQGLINVQSGHIQSIQKIGCVLGGKIAGLKNLETARSKENSRQGGIAACKIKHEKKDEITGKSFAAVEMGLASAKKRKLLSDFCKVVGIKKPGKNYINVDKQAFEQWRFENAC